MEILAGSPRQPARARGSRVENAFFGEGKAQDTTSVEMAAGLGTAQTQEPRERKTGGA